MRCYVENINLASLALPKSVTDYLSQLDAETAEILSNAKSHKKWTMTEEEKAEQESLEDKEASIAVSIDSERSQMALRRFLMA